MDLEDLLRGLVGRVASERPELAAKLEHAVPLEFSEGKLVLGWGPGNVFGDLVARPETTAELERVATAMLGKPTRISHELESARVAGKKTLSRLEAEERERKVREAYDRARRHPRIAEAAEILGAKLRDLKLAKAP